MPNIIKQNRRYLLTASIVIIAIIAFTYKYYDYIVNPWTRNGQVSAEIIQMVPRVSGQIVQLPIKNNQYVETGDLLFEIDPRVYSSSLKQALAELDETLDNYNALLEQINANVAQVQVSKYSISQASANIAGTNATIEKNKAEYQRQQDLLPKKATSLKAVQRAKANYDISLEQKKSTLASLSQAQASLTVAQANLAQSKASLGAMGDDNSKIRAARAKVEQARLNLEFTQMLAPTDGYVTNLNLKIGGQAVANQPLLALVDINSYWISAFFKEDLVGRICTGNRAIVTLMSYPDISLEGQVDNIGWGISQQDGSTGFELLPSISPTFEWIRLAQRIPVNIKLLNPPKEIALRVGTTASVIVYSDACSQADMK
jgi:multidrug resistance efflux pump